MKKEISPKILTSLSESIQKINEAVLGGSFLLGLHMGISSKCSNHTDAIAWVKRNFGHHDFLINAIDKAIAKERFCSDCDTQNNTSDNFCSNCGKKLE